MNRTTRACPICGRAYFVYPMMAKDQSACPSCVREAEEAAEANAPHPWIQRRTRGLRG